MKKDLGSTEKSDIGNSKNTFSNVKLMINSNEFA
jgi:hypothetical protein